MAISPIKLRKDGFKTIEDYVEKCEEYVDNILQEDKSYTGMFKVPLKDLPLNGVNDYTQRVILSHISNKYSEVGWRVQVTYSKDEGYLSLIDPKIYYNPYPKDVFSSIESMFPSTFKRLMLT